jgi:maleylpyruvate isomerase
MTRPMKLYNFFRSGTSHRVRIALNVKGLAYEYAAVDLRSEQHLAPDFKAVNPQGLVPALVLDDGRVLTQSPAILEWLEERHPQPPLLPTDAEDRARVRALAAIVANDIHPINNRRVLEYLRGQVGLDDVAIGAWCATWIEAGFDAFDALLAADKGRGDFCFGEVPTMADVALIPQIESARRFKVDMRRWPRLEAVDKTCSEIDAFRRAAPACQPDSA